MSDNQKNSNILNRNTTLTTAKDILLSLFGGVLGAAMIMGNWIIVAIFLVILIVIILILDKLQRKIDREQIQALKELEDNIVNRITANMPSKEDINKLTTAIDKLTKKIDKQPSNRVEE
jgi:uncharacterized membrane protein